MNNANAAPDDRRRAQLEELLNRLPADKAEKLREILCSQAGDQPISPMLADIIKRLALRAGDGGEDQPNALMRRICVLFEPFLVPSDNEADWVIRRASLMPWWQAAMAASAALGLCETKFIEAARARQPAALERAVAEAYDYLADISPTLAMGDAASALSLDVRKMTTLLKGRRDLVPALAAIEVGGPVKPGREIEIDAKLTAGFTRQHLKMLNEAKLEPSWLGHAVMNRLAQPAAATVLIRAVLVHDDPMAAVRRSVEPLIRRVLGHLDELGKAAETDLRRAAKIRRAAEITQAAIAAESYFTALCSAGVDADLAGQAPEHRVLRDLVMTAVWNTLGLFEGTIAGFLRHWQPRPTGDDGQGLAAALHAAALLGAVHKSATSRGIQSSAAAAISRLTELLCRPPALAGSAPEQWSREQARLVDILRPELTGSGGYETMRA